MDMGGDGGGSRTGDKLVLVKVQPFFSPEMSVPMATSIKQTYKAMYK